MIFVNLAGASLENRDLTKMESSAAEDLNAGKNQSILLADDDPVLRKLLVRVLRDAGYTVIAATDGSTALNVARKHEGRIDLLITDVMMPRLDGFDLRERLLLERRNTRILLMSGQFEKGMIGEEFPILRKPFRPEEFLEKVREVLASQP